MPEGHEVGVIHTYLHDIAVHDEADAGVCLGDVQRHDLFKIDIIRCR